MELESGSDRLRTDRKIPQYAIPALVSGHAGILDVRQGVSYFFFKCKRGRVPSF